MVNLKFFFALIESDFLLHLTGFEMMEMVVRCNLTEDLNFYP